MSPLSDTIGNARNGMFPVDRQSLGCRNTIRLSPSETTHVGFLRGRERMDPDIAAG